MTTDDLAAQAAREAKELEAVPKVPVTQFHPSAAHGESGRCGWCGQFTDDLVMAEPALADPHGNILRPARYKGVKCCGGRHL